MLALKQTPNNSRPILKTTKSLPRGLVLAGALLSCSLAALASPVVNSINYTFSSIMTNTGADADARGTVRGSLARRGTNDTQKLSVVVSKLDASTAYDLNAFLD